MTNFVETYLHLKDTNKKIVANQDSTYMFHRMPASGLVPVGDFHPGKIKFDDWLKSSE